MIPDLVEAKRVLSEERYQAGEAMFLRGGVREDAIGENQLRYMVHDTPARMVTIGRGPGACCNCEEYHEKGSCIHVVAALLKARGSGALGEMEHRYARSAAPKLFSSMAALLPERGNVRLALYLQVEQDHRHAFPTLRAGLRVGDDRLYVIRHIPHFLDSMDRGEPVELGKGFTFVPEWMRFNDKDRDILQAFRALLAAQREGGQEFHGSETRLLPVPADFIDIFLRRVHYGTFLLSMGGENHAVRTVRRASVPLFFRVEGSLCGLTVTGILPGDLLPLTADCSYVIMGGNIIEVDAIQREIIRAMWEEWTEVSEGESRFEYTPGETSEVVDTLLPFLKRVGVVELSEDLERMLVRLPLKARVYIDVDGRDITARTVFGYGEREIDPFTPARAQVTLRRGEHLLMRDSEAERQVMDTLAASGFGMTDGKVLLSGNEAVYTFVTEGVHTLRQHAEVFLSKDFSKFRPKPVRLKAHLAMRGPRLAMTFTDDTLPVEEARPILEAIARKKKYFRLKDGTFLDLTGLEAWQPFAAGVTESVNAGTDQAPAGEVNVWACQTFYLSSLLENLHAECTMDAQVQGMIQAVGESGEVLVLPERLAHYLRDYQLFGVKWLRTMDRLKMGGVLADDMGLGKTIQTIAMVATTLQEGEMALVVAPSSLTYNWQKEFSFFAPEIRTHVVSGANAQRMAFFADLSGGEIRDV
ncbi:MAG: SNF2 helicase associated domain-containing protein, partial [Clostridia bacterium]|nr:SNF2 helicase associated domain-containing protein [Clostridia bacterium]